MMINSSVRISDGWLLCPRCDNDYLHHRAITVFARGEDAEITQVTRIVAGAVTVEASPSCTVANPSSRRHGLVIAFWCENCDGVNELTIVQHKGRTAIEWRQA